MLAPSAFSLGTASSPPADSSAPDPSVVLHVRRFGTEMRDLAIDVARPTGPDLVTAILGACLLDGDGAPLGERLLWQMTVGARIAWLLVLAGQEQSGPFAVSFRCSTAGCDEAIEVELTLEEILSVAHVHSRGPIQAQADGARFTLRRPTGLDQLAWLRNGSLNAVTAADAVHPVLRSLVVAGPVETLTVAGAAELEAALDEHDPLVRFTVTAVCPSCGFGHEYEAPLAECALGILRAVHARLIDDVHALARGYGWREVDVLAVPAWRRARYLTLLEREGRR